MIPKIRKRSPIHENADANIACDFGDGDISRLGVAYLRHMIHRYLDYIKMVCGRRREVRDGVEAQSDDGSPGLSQEG